MGNKLSSRQPEQIYKPSDLDLPQHGTWRGTKASVKFSPSTKMESFCNPGPRPQFVGYKQKTRFNPVSRQKETYEKKSKLLPLAVYLNEYESYDNKKYGCNPGQYIKYENGHYCCVGQEFKATPQEMLDFVNRALESFFDNVGYSSAPNAYTRDKYDYSIKELDFLLYHRRNIMTKNVGLVDNLEVPPYIDADGNETPITLDDWVSRFKKRELALTDTLEDSEKDSEQSTLTSMRSETRSNGAPFYTRRKSGQPKFGGKNKKNRRSVKKNARRKSKTQKN